MLLLVYVRAANELEINPSWMGLSQIHAGEEKGSCKRLRFTRVFLTTASPWVPNQE